MLIFLTGILVMWSIWKRVCYNNCCFLNFYSLSLTYFFSYYFFGCLILFFFHFKCFIKPLILRTHGWILMFQSGMCLVLLTCMLVSVYILRVVLFDLLIKFVLTLFSSSSLKQCFIILMGSILICQNGTLRAWKPAVRQQVCQKCIPLLLFLIWWLYISL